MASLVADMSDYSKKNEPIIRLFDSADDTVAVSVDLGPLEPVFSSESDRFKPPPVEAMARMSDFLAHQVSRRPKDLTNHVQRIALCHEVGDNVLVYGAVIDLFIALGDSGMALRARILKKVADLLTEEQSRALQRGLVSGLLAHDEMPVCRYSRLSAGVIGGTRIVDVISSAESGRLEYGALDEARDLIDSGHIELAQKLLEETLLNDRFNEEISRELLEIYRHTRYGDALSSMKGQLGEEVFALSDEWDVLASSFAEQDESGNGVNG